MKRLKNTGKSGERAPLIQLKDDYITNIYEESVDQEGCETCDYGSKYGVEYEISFRNHPTFFFSLTSMYKRRISEGDIIRFFLMNLDEFSGMTHDEFCAFISDIGNITTYNGFYEEEQ